jgi:hypothetical protein
VTGHVPARFANSTSFLVGFERVTGIGGLGGLTVLLVSTGLISGADSETMKVALIAAFTACLVVFNVGLFLLGYALWSAPGVAGRQLEPAPLA